MENQLKNMDLGAAMALAREVSGLSYDEIAWLMNCSVTVAKRIMNPADNYWPSMPTIPALCAVFKNDILLQWMRAQFNALSDGINMRLGDIQPDDVMHHVLSITGEIGDLSRVARNASGDGTIDGKELKHLIKEARQVVSVSCALLSGLEHAAHRGMADHWEGGR